MRAVLIALVVGLFAAFAQAQVPGGDDPPGSDTEMGGPPGSDSGGGHDDSTSGQDGDAPGDMGSDSDSGGGPGSTPQ